jgi:hypothetical protein
MMRKQQMRHSRESGNPGEIMGGKCMLFLDARLRGHDEPWLLKIRVTNY